MAQTNGDLENRYNKFLHEKYKRQYQEAALFAMKFQKSERCSNFRKAWEISKDGFLNHAEYNSWWAELLQKANRYLKSKERKKHEEWLAVKRLEWIERKITQGELQFFADRVHLQDLVHKHDFDMNRIVLEEKKPAYWKPFVEQLLHFARVEPSPVLRPSPEPKLVYDNFNHIREIVVQNIFADTTVKDFARREFVEKLKKLQKHLYDHSPSRPRARRTFEVALQLAELDKKGGMTDWEKGEEIFGPIEDLDFGEQERRRLFQLRQMRKRTKRKLGEG